MKQLKATGTFQFFLFEQLTSVSNRKHHSECQEP